MPPRLTVEVQRGSLSPRVTFLEVLLVWISIVKTFDREES